MKGEKEPRAGRRAKREQRKKERTERERAAEAERMRKFGESVESLKSRGFTATDRTIGIKAANVFGLLTALPFAAAAVLLFAVFAPAVRNIFPQLFCDIFLLAGLGLVSIPVHEALHGLFWGIANGTFRGIRFGVMRELWTPYCACEMPMKRGKYILGTAAPFVLLGIGFSAAGIITGFWLLLAVGVYNIFCAGADLLICFRVIFSCPQIVLDHPNKCGYFCFYKKK